MCPPSGGFAGSEVRFKAGRHTPTAGSDQNATFNLRNGVGLYGMFAGTETALFWSLALLLLTHLALPVSAKAEFSWKQTYNGVANHTDVGYAVAVDASDNSVYVTGETEVRRLGRDLLLRKYSAAGGTPLWMQTFNGNANGHDSGILTFFRVEASRHGQVTWRRTWRDA